MNNELNEEQASLYVLGALSPDEMRAFEQALESDESLRKLVTELRAASAALPYALSPIQPRAELKENIFQRLDQPRLSVVPLPDQQSPNRTPLIWLAALSGWVAAACIWFEYGGYKSRLEEIHKTNSDLSDVVHQREREIAEMRLENEVLNAKLAILLRRDPLKDRKLIRLGPPEQNAPPAAVVLWDEKAQSGTLLLDHLPEAAAGKDYQLWIIDPSQTAPIDCGLISTPGTGVNTLDFKPKLKVSQIGKFAITLERKGGAPAPEGSMVLIGG